MIIAVLKDLKLFDAGSKTGVIKIIKKIKVTSNIITLDLTRCIIDYPVTSSIIDKILYDLEKQTKPRVLTIQTHLNIIEELILHWLFIGSIYLKIDDSKKKNSLEEFKDLISKQLNPKSVKIQLQVINKAGKIIKEYKYG